MNFFSKFLKPLGFTILNLTLKEKQKCVKSNKQELIVPSHRWGRQSLKTMVTISVEIALVW
jgi:hypothetical protein